VNRDHQTMGHSTSNNNLSQVTDKASIVVGATVSNSTIIMQHSNLNNGQLNNRSSIDSNTHKILILIEENEKLIRINEELMKET
jgi:hypothetical protein